MTVRCHPSLLAIALLLAAATATAAQRTAPAASERDDARAALLAAPPTAKSENVRQAHCVRRTGTRIVSQRLCLPGRAYTREDIRRSGALTVGEALRRLDPSIR